VVFAYEPLLFNVLRGFDRVTIKMMIRDDEVTTLSMAIISSPIWYNVPIFNMEDMPCVYQWYNNILENFSSHVATGPMAISKIFPVLLVHRHVVCGSF